MSMLSLAYRVLERREENADTATLTLAPQERELPAWTPGQFTMVYAFGIGEVPISISGGEGRLIRHTVREVGAVSRAIRSAPVGSVLGLRGPYGQGWPPPPGKGDVVVVAGGVGLGPVRPVVVNALARPDRAGRVVVLIGARTPEDLLFTTEYDDWREAGADVLVTVDRGTGGWRGRVGLVTTLLAAATFTPSATAYVCGPEVMMRLTGSALVERGLSPRRTYVSLERNMRCGIALCGHCQLGPLLICRDGPVASYDVAEPLFAIGEL